MVKYWSKHVAILLNIVVFTCLLQDFFLYDTNALIYNRITMAPRVWLNHSRTHKGIIIIIIIITNDKK